MCGGTSANPRRAVNPGGLSPRVRGNPVNHILVSEICGSIPACAGEPYSLVFISLPPPVYPRVCGGTKAAANTQSQSRGLSPRVRGNRPAARPGLSVSRSIPACAGEPCISEVASDKIQVYPRVCGGTVMGGRGADTDRGLSPRVRGNRSSVVLLHLSSRSIPACAGEPQKDQDFGGYSRVYPRVCGGTCKCPVNHSRLPGLSPRVRGNHSTWRVPG